ncbi:MAG TPA: hypothetical protein VIL20_24310, partial [Sandaracinaceae bacterium]
MGRCESVLAALALPLWLGACGGGVPAEHAAPAAARPDPAVELAALLPDDVERCVLVRPGLVAERRRSLVLLMSLADPTAWTSELHPVAYASAVATTEDGKRAQRAYYRFADDARERAREVLPVRWLDEPCEDHECRLPVARWIDERTLEVARYAWPRRVRGISSAACVQLAREDAEAVELAAEAVDQVASLPLTQRRPSSYRLRVEAGSVVSRREVVLEDAVQGRILEARLRARAAFADPALVPLGPGRRRIERDAERVAIVETRLWEELELAVEDDALRLRAIALGEMRSEPVPLARVRVDDLSAVRHQVRLRRARLARLPPEGRRAAAEELATLLERAWAAHPSELSFARSLARLSLDALGAPRRALAVVEDVLARGLADAPEAWRALRREALAAVSAEELARALVADAIAPAAEAARAAEDLRALVEHGVPYDWAEGAWRASRELFAGRGPRRPADARLPFGGALGALVAWARMGEVERNVTVQVAVRSSAASEPRAIGESRPEVVAVRAPSGGTIYVG